MVTRFFMLVLAIVLLAGVAYAPSTEQESAPFVMEYRVERVCASPKYVDGRTQHTTHFTTELAKVGVRYAGCSAPEPKPAPVEVLPTIEEEPKLSCPSYTMPLFDSKGTLAIGSILSSGGYITDMTGDWVVQSQDGILVAEEGRTMTIAFLSPVQVDSVVIYDNDPKQGETGWSLNGYPLRTTGNERWGWRFDFQITTSQLVFEKGDDSPHFNVCVLK